MLLWMDTKFMSFFSQPFQKNNSSSASTPSKPINLYDFQKYIQSIVIKLNAANKKYVIFSIYRTTKQNKMSS